MSQQLCILLFRVSALHNPNKHKELTHHFSPSDYNIKRPRARNTCIHTHLKTLLLIDPADLRVSASRIVPALRAMKARSFYSEARRGSKAGGLTQSRSRCAQSFTARTRDDLLSTGVTLRYTLFDVYGPANRLREYERNSNYRPAR
jgi:hypothetical protein